MASAPPTDSGSDEVRLDAASVKRARILGAGALLGALALQLFTGQLGEGRLRENLFDLYQRLHPRAIEHGEAQDTLRLPARIVVIDEASLEEIGPWPWPRARLAELSERIFARGALAIGFDMVFPEPDLHGVARLLESHPDLPSDLRERLQALQDPDRQFADLIARSRVVLGRAGLTDESIASPRYEGDLVLEAEFPDAPPPRSLLQFSAALTNIAQLDFVAAGHGLLNGAPDSDGVVRQVPLLAAVDGQFAPSLVLELMRVGQRRHGYGLEGDEDSLRAIALGERRIPTAPDGRIRPYFTAPSVARATSAHVLSDPAFMPRIFANSVVLVTAASIGLDDVVATPISAENLGTDVLAQTIETINSGAWLSRPRWAPFVELGLAALLGLLAIALFPRFSPLTGIAAMVGVAALLLSGSVAGFVTLRLLMDPIAPAFGGGVAAVATLAELWVETEKARRALRIRAIKIDAELKFAEDIQHSMLPAPAALKALSPAVELEASLEQARGVGGDLFDAFLLDERQLFFMIGDVTDKGVPASLFMSLAKALTRSTMLHAVEHQIELGEAIALTGAEINRENQEGMFLAALFGILDLETGEASLCNAGQDNPILLRADGSAEEFAMVGGPPLCVVDEFLYPVERVVLAPGEILLATTDGAAEARALDDTLFGRPRLLTTLRELERPVTAEAAVATVVSAVQAFQAGTDPSDDLTVIGIRYKGFST